ncbi:hypothetical protein [Vibrio mediterranei]|uniref:hypothetical protein n=1 Tax=Vibrio mediterranei TaxID=689 RepID=UPI004068474E
MFQELPPALEDVLQSYIDFEIPESLEQARLCLLEGEPKIDYSLDPNSVEFFQQTIAASDFKLRSFHFSQSLADIGIYCPISMEGAKFIRDIANGRQIVDPFAGRAHIASALRKIGVNVLCGDKEPHHPFTEIYQCDCLDLIAEAESDALLLLAWPPRSKVDSNVAEKWGQREILYIGDPGETTGSSRFSSNYECECLFDFPDNVFTHVNSRCYLGHYKRSHSK